MEYQALSDQDLVSLCEGEIQTCMGREGEEMAEERADMLDYYFGEMDQHLPSEDGRSSFASRDVMDVVESVLPNLMRIFIDSENSVVFKPKGPEDEAQAELETKAVRHVFFEQNNGFLVLYSFFKDALLSNTGVAKCWTEEPILEKETHTGVTLDEYNLLISDPAVEVDSIEVDQRDDGLLDVALKVRKTEKKIVVETLPPEEFGVSPECRSPDIKKTPFAYHRRRMTKPQLLEAGFDPDIVETLPFGTTSYDSEQYARYRRHEEIESAWRGHQSMRTVWVNECYIQVDADADGIAELLKVTFGGDIPGGVFLSAEEIDSIPFAAASPVLVTHKFHGESLATLVKEIQEVRTVLIRGILDNTYLSNNARVAANENVNWDDLLISRAGGVVRIMGDSPPAQNLMALQHPPIPQGTYAMLDVLDKLSKNRTGVGDEVMGLDINSLANVNTGVMLQAYDMARGRIEMMARILAEVGVKQIFRNIHELMCKNIDRPLRLKIGGQWMQVDPREWRQRDDIEAKVGLGYQTRERKIMALQGLIGAQTAVMQSGAPIITPANIYASHMDLTEATGLSGMRYFTPPEQMPPPQPSPPDPRLVEAQSDAERVNIERQELQLKAQELQLNALAQDRSNQARTEEASIKREMEIIKAQLQLRKQEVDEQSQLINAMVNKERQQSEEVIAGVRMALETDRLEWQKRADEADNRLEKYKADLAALVKLVDETKAAVIGSLKSELGAMRGQIGRTN